MFEKLKRSEKTNVNITIDKDLLIKLQAFKDKIKVKNLSPMINEILWDWINKEEI